MSAEGNHILFVDDSPVLLRTVVSCVPAEYRVSMATSAEQAYKVIERDMPDLIFLDYEMPGVDGKELLFQFRTDPKMDGIPVVFLTSKSRREDFEAVMEMEPEGYILKPPSMTRIRTTINRFLN